MSTKREKIQSIIIAILSIVIIFGAAYFASELKYCDNSIKEIELVEIDMSEFTTLYNDSNPSLIYIARPGCGFCTKQKPIVKQLVEKYGLVFHYLNTDNLTKKEMESIFELDKELFGEDGKDFGTPTTLIVQNGEIVDSLVGLTQLDEFEEFLIDNEILK